MRRTVTRMTFAVTLASMIAASASTSASAFTLPATLPVAKGEKWTGVNVGNTTLQSGSLTVECTTATAEGSVTEANGALGPFHFSFKGCTGKLGEITAKCTGLGDPTEDILMLGEYHIVVDKNTPELTAAILLLVEELHYSCGGLMLVKLKGSVLCLILEPLTSKASHEYHCKQIGGKQEQNKYFNDSGTEVASKLESATNEAAFVEDGLGGLFTIVFPKAVKFDD